jgi:3',5'-nucleoside bisphosphate phosphatase
VRIDLHSHSRVSDGTTSPSAVVERAAEVGLDVLALTDHDSAGGWAEAAEAARRVGIGFVPGIELSTIHQDRGVHLLAYLVDPTFGPLAAELDRILGGRDGRLPAILNNLAAVDVSLTEGEVRRQAGDHQVIGRPHVADALVARGFVRDRQQAFDEYLRPGRPGFVVRYAPETADMVRLVSSAGGASVVAHPWGRESRHVLDAEEFGALADAGLVGVEIDHKDHTAADRTALRRIAHDLALVVTGSSDYHGVSSGSPELGAHLTAPGQFERLMAAAGANALHSGLPVAAAVEPELRGRGR